MPRLQATRPKEVGQQGNRDVGHLMIDVRPMLRAKPSDAVIVGKQFAAGFDPLVESGERT
ncbi:hypothetical protein D3C83_208000 [compost metagenome]